MKIVYITGACAFQFGEAMWQHYRSAFAAQFPEAEITIAHTFYFPWQRERVQALEQQVLDTVDTGEELLLYGHSLGGVIACSVATKLKRSSVRAVVTYGAPHKIGRFYRWLGVVPQRLSCPVLTFSGTFDFIVPSFWARYPGSRHTTIYSDHFVEFIFRSRPAEIISQEMKKQLALEAQNGKLKEGEVVVAG